jgi:hypothetical protein
MSAMSSGARGVRGVLRLVLIAGLATQGLEGCAMLHAGTTPSPASDWPSALSLAQGQASAGQFDEADSTLARFATRYPGTPEAAETAYWRALYRLDPTNQHASITTALASLDGYLADPRPRTHVAEATIIRRVAGQLDATNHLAANAMSQARDANVTASTAKAQAADARADAARADAARASAEAPPPNAEAEIKRLKDELAKANAELERIRKRLTPPSGKP